MCNKVEKAGRAAGGRLRVLGSPIFGDASEACAMDDPAVWAWDDPGADVVRPGSEHAAAVERELLEFFDG